MLFVRILLCILIGLLTIIAVPFIWLTFAMFGWLFKGLLILALIGAAVWIVCSLLFGDHSGKI